MNARKMALNIPININKATLEDLMLIPGIGETTALRIIQFRESAGGFHTLEDLMKIRGIKEKKFEHLKKYLYAGKNAILIVEFAKMKRDEGMPTLEAALEGAKLRLRPILMTSFAFILGCVPLMLASGSGAASRSTMGTGVVFGMTISTAIGLFLIPVCYVFVQKFSDRKEKKAVAAREEVV